MKKIVCLLLILTCTIALFACGGESAGDSIVKIVNSSKPTKITTNVYYTYDGDTLESQYVTNFVENGFEFDYMIQTFADPEVDGGSEPIKTVEDKIYYENGKYSFDRETWFTEAPDVTLNKIGFKLDLKTLGKYTLSRDKNSITATVSAQKAEKLFGALVEGADEDGVTITITTNGSKLVNIEISYVTAQAEVVIDTSYEYIPVAAPEQPAE